MDRIEMSSEWRGRELIDADDRPVGSIEEIYLDDETDAPEWALVSLGRFGSRQMFVPIVGMVAAGEQVRVPFTEETLRTSPRVAPAAELPPDAEAELYRHFGMSQEREPDRGAHLASDALERQRRPSASPRAEQRKDPTVWHDDAGASFGHRPVSEDERRRIIEARREYRRLRAEIEDELRDLRRIAARRPRSRA
jgi:hypothetical protein